MSNAIKRIFVSLTDKGQEYQETMGNAALARAKGDHTQVTVEYAEGSSVLQVDQVLKAIRTMDFKTNTPLMSYDAIVIEPVQNGCTVFKSVLKSGRALVLMNTGASEVFALRKEYPNSLIFAVTNDHRKIGEMQARQVMKRLPKGGNILYVVGLRQHPAAQDRLLGFRSALEGSYKVSEGDGFWTADGGEKVARWFKANKPNDRLDMIICQNDRMAEGVLRSGLFPKEVPVTGCDGLESGKALVASGKLFATIATPLLTIHAIEGLMNYWKIGGDIQPPAFTRIEPEAFPENSI